MYESEEMSFELFAYEFADTESAKAYFKNETGISRVLNTHFLSSNNARNYKLIVIDGCNAYYIHGKTTDKEEIESFLSCVFSKQIVKQESVVK